MRNKYLILAAISCCSAIATAQEYLRVGEHVIPVEEIDSITFENNYVEDFLPAHITADPNVSIFGSALKLTGLDKLLNVYVDYDYAVNNEDPNDWKPYDWDFLFFRSARGGEYFNVAYPRYRKINFTVFAEPDSIYARNGISNLSDLKVYAAKVYDEMYPEDAGIQNPTDRRNSLNRFVAYHILDRRGEYDKLTNADMSGNFFRNLQDMADWYETLMPHSILKCSFPAGEQSGLYINRRGVQNHADLRGVFVKGAKVLHSGGEKGYEIGASHGIVNGMYYYIDDIITYGKQTQEVVLDERMRIDCTTLSPDFMTSGARGHETRWVETDYKFGIWTNSQEKGKNNTCLGFDTAANFTIGDTPRFLVSNRFKEFWDYQGDLIYVAKSDGGDVVTFKLPPLPAGTYELRMGICLGYSTNGMLKFYLDNEECGETVDFRVDGQNLGWKSPDYFYDYSSPNGIIREYEEFLWKDWQDGDDEPVDTEEKRKAYSETAKKEYFKSFREKGWMHGPASYGPAAYDGSSPASNSFYKLPNTLRRIITTFTTDGKTDHYLRIFHDREAQMATGSWENNLYFGLDYIELCPSSVYDNELYPEDEY